MRSMQEKNGKTNKKGSKSPLSKAKIYYLVPDTNPSLGLRFLTFLYRVHF
jgi:hypothetical protein